MEGRAILPLEIFPAESLSSSVITTVWIGVFVVVALNMRFGTTLSGLVVPGYLVPILLVKPISAAIIILEAVITYLIARALSYWLVKFQGACEFFGRDRFFALVLISVSVRLALDGYIFPAVGEALINQGLQFDYRNHLHSFGLIIVSLMANQFWNANLVQGLRVTLLTIGITYLLIRFGLMTFTNFEISNLSYLYEDLASSILASPKAYIILILSAFIASRMNLAYGWEYNGILIPSLLALQWYQPEKLLATFLEAFIILYVGKMLLRLKLFQHTNIEGGRLLLLFFNIGFFYKLGLAYLILHIAPALKITDHYGFGYLLSTLIALKIYQKDILARLTRATLQTSAVAALLATFVGFSLSLLPAPFLTMLSETVPSSTLTQNSNKTLTEYIAELKSRLYGSTIDRTYPVPTSAELQHFDAGLQALLATDKVTSFTQAQQHFHIAGFKLITLQEGLVGIQEIDNERGWGNLIINPSARSDLLISVPAPLSEPIALDIAPWIFSSQGAKALMIHGSMLDRDLNGHSNVLTNPNTLFHKIHQRIGYRNTLQLRSYSKKLARELYAETDLQGVKLPTDLPRALYVKRTLPTDLTLTPFSQAIGQLPTHWAALPSRNIQREESYAGFAELIIDRDGARQMIKSSVLQKPIHYSSGIEKIDGYLTQWLLSEKVKIAEKGSNAYQTAKLSELVYLDQEVLRPLLTFAANIRDDEDILDNPEYQFMLADLNTKAAAIGYDINLYQHALTKKRYLIFKEQTDVPEKHWGLVVIKLGYSQPFIVEVPRPLAERQTFEFGATLFEAVDARVIVFAGAHADANRDGSSDVLSIAHKQTLFNLVHQTSLTQMQDLHPLVLQIRGFAARQQQFTPNVDLLVAFWQGLPRAPSAAMHNTLTKVLNDQGIRHRMVKGDGETVGFEAAYNAQTGFLAAIDQADLAVLWLSQEYRQQYTDQAIWQTKLFNTLLIRTEIGDLAQQLADQAWHTQGCHLRDRFIDQFTAWKNTGNIHSLYYVVQNLKDFQLRRVIDKGSLQAFLVVSQMSTPPQPNENIAFIINLNSKIEAPNLQDQQPTIGLDRMQDHIRRRASSLCGRLL